MNHCKICAAGLLNAFEGELCLCSSCIKKSVESAVKLSLLYKAEDEGKDSFKIGKADDENPYEAGSAECVMWLNGWEVESTKRKTQEVIAVMKWAHKNLIHIHELAKGYGLDEIDKKLYLTIEKLGMFLESDEP